MSRNGFHVGSGITLHISRDDKAPTQIGASTQTPTIVLKQNVDHNIPGLVFVTYLYLCISTYTMRHSHYNSR